MIRLSEELAATIRNHGSNSFPLECVGALIGSLDPEFREVQEARLLPNSFDPSWESTIQVGNDGAGPGQERRYMIAPYTMFELLREERRTGRKILGFYHSHPNHPAKPSIFDRDWSTAWYTYIIVSVQNGTPKEITAWQLDEENNELREEEIEICQKF